MADQKIAPVNFMLLLSEAVAKDQETESNQQIIDANSTEIATNLESTIYEHWIGILDYDTSMIQAAAKTGKNANNNVAIWQSKYSENSAAYNSNTARQNGAIQADQGQTQSDATNLQSKAQTLQGVNQLLSSLANILQQGVVA